MDTVCPRVTHLIPQIGIGGAEMQLCRLVSLAPKQRAIQDVLYYSDSLDQDGFRVYRDAGINFDRVERGKIGPHSFLRRLAGEIGRRKPDILHCWLASGALWGRWGGILAGVPRIVLSFRSTRVDLATLLRISRWADGRRVHYLVNSNAVAAAVATRIGVRRPRITIIPNGIDLDRPQTAFSREALLREHGCPPGTRIALTVGRLTDAKNYPMLLRIAARCRGRLPVHFFVAGHGEREGELRALAARLGLEDVVHFLGLRHDVQALLRAADVFCYTSRYEGFPNALLESMAAECPIITTRFIGHEDLIEAGRTALAVAQDDDAGAFDALTLLINDAEMARALAAAARRAAETRFSLARMVEATLGYYEGLMKGAV